MTTIVTNDTCLVLYGLASELELVDKTSVGNGTTYIAIDTSERYLFDAENKVWLVQAQNTILGG